MNVVRGTVSGTGSVKGSVGTIYGKDGKSAYEIALEKGFEGTEAEWVASLKGEKGETGNPGIYIGSGDMPEDCNVQIDPNGDTLGIEDIKRLLGVSAPKIAYIQLPASAWEGADNLYSQVVTIDGVTERSKVDLLPSVEQLAVFYNKDVAFVTENENGVITVYAIGEKPQNDYTMQVSITEVLV